MKKKPKKTIFITLLAITAMSTCFAFYLYNKGPLDVKNSKGIKVKAVDLYSLYYTDTIIAKNMYTGKILEVNGVLKEISLNMQQQQVLLLKTGTAEAAINCTMELPLENIKTSDKLTVKGICSGLGQGDADLGILGDVYLTRCYSQTNNSNR